MTTEPIEVEWDPVERVFKVPRPPARYIDERGRVIVRCEVCNADGIVEGASMDRHVAWRHPDRVAAAPKRPFWRRWWPFG